MKLNEVCFDIVEMLDNVVDRNVYPDDGFKQYQELLRTLGVGTTGLATMLQMLNLKYGTEEANIFIDELYNVIAKYLYSASVELAKTKGSFKLFDANKYLQSGFFTNHDDLEWKQIKSDIRKHGIRNARLISIAPSGTTSLVFGNNCSSGIEPVFMYEYSRDIKIGGQTDENIKKVTMNDYGWGLYKELFGEDSEMPEHFTTAMELSVEQHVETLSHIAKHVDMAISKTVNVPTDYPFEDAKNIYMDAWKKGIKGVTIFRPNELRKGIFNTDTKEEKSENNTLNLEWGTVIESSDELIGRKTKIQTGCGSLHISGFFDEYTGELQEVFLNKGGSGGCLGYMSGLSRMISLSLRAGIPFETVFEQLTSVQGCPSYVVRTKTNGDTSKGNNCSSAIGFALKKMLDDVKYDLGILEEAEIHVKQSDKQQIKPTTQLTTQFIRCPECGEMSASNSTGCLTCISCGFSKCS